MSGIEVVGAVLGVLPLLWSSASAGLTFYDWVKKTSRLLMDVYRKASLVAVSLLGTLPDSFVTMERIERVLNGSPAELLEFRQSGSSNMNMVAIAGAIVAQIGITALTLNDVQEAHWTAAAFFMSSLIFGVMSVTPNPHSR